MKKHYKIMALLICASMLMSCSNNNSTASTNPTNVTNEGSENSNVELNIKTMSQSLVEYAENDFYTEWESENLTYIKLNTASAEIEGAGAEIKGNIITIKESGTYVVSGKLSNGQIVVNSDSDEAVRLVLNNADITCLDNSPIYVKDSSKTIISLAANTENILTDGSSYELNDASDEQNAAIFSMSDLTFNGPGTLTVNANYNNGIVGKDNLKITGGNITINSVDDGLLGRDLLAVKDSNLTINSQGDSMKSTNDTDVEKGNIVLENGSYIITSGSDGIQAENKITIIDGKYTIVSNDDSIHSNSTIDISGGTINITSEDDGIHADSTINIAGGTINILKSYEGIESSIINISDGNIKLISSDDGINVAGGKDGSALMNTTEQKNFNSTDNNSLNISGGSIYVVSSGDGLDANGSIYMNGGTVIVNGPESNGNGAIDYDQKFELNGGLLIAAGSSGMAQTPSETSTQNSVLISYSQIQNAGTIVNLSDADGNNIITFSPSKGYQSILISSPNLKLNSNYALYTGGSYNGIENNGLYNDGSYENGIKLTDLTISKSILSISETGEEVTRGNFMPGQGVRGMKGGGKNFPEGEMPQRPNNIPPDSSSGSTENNEEAEALNENTV